MNKKLKYFSYSQNSINTHKSCPLKFKYKYIDKINWKNDDVESREYYEGLKVGRDFHLLCERYFTNIPLGINENTNPKFVKWIEKIKTILPQYSDSRQVGETYLPEYEVRYNLNGSTIIAKYDLVVIKENSIEIWDWKTENRILEYKNIENRMQSIVYMFLAKEVIPKLMNLDIDINNIKMKYYQPQHDNPPVEIGYNEQKHKANEEKISKQIDMIQKTKYEEEQEAYEYELIKNKKHCNFCEFNKLCNGQEVDYRVLEEEIYEC